MVLETKYVDQVIKSTTEDKGDGVLAVQKS